MKPTQHSFRVFFVLFVSVSGLYAQKTSTGSDWSNPNHWSPVGVPTNTDDVIIDSDISVPAAGGPYEVNQISYSHNQTNTLTIDGELRLVGTSPGFDNTGGPGEFGQLSVSSTGTLLFSNGTDEVDLSGAVETGVSVTGIFVLNATPINSSIIQASWETGSTCQVTNVINATGKVIGNLGQSFYNFEWDSPGQSGFMEFDGELAQVGNDMIIKNTGSGSLVFESGNVSNYSLNVANDLIINDGGAVLFAANGGTSANIVIGGDLAWYNDANSTPTSIADGQDVTVQVFGDLVLSGGADNSFEFATLIFGGGPTSTLELHGDFLHSGGIINVGDGAANATLRIMGSPSTYTNASAASPTAIGLNISVASGATLQVEIGSAVKSSGQFTLESGSTLSVTNEVGLDNASGIVQTGTKVFQTSSSLVFAGSTAQFFGNGFPSGDDVNVEIDNVNGVTNNVVASGTTTIAGELKLTSGSLTIGDQNTLELTGPITSTSGSLRGFYNGSDNVGTSTLIIGGSAGAAISGDIAFDNTGNGNVLNELQIVRPSVVPIGSDLIIEGIIANANGVLNLTGTLDIKSNSLTLGGSFVDNGGSLASNGGNLILNGTGDMGDPLTFSGGAAIFTDITVNRTSGGVVHFGGGAQINGLLYLQNGEADLDAPLTIGDNATINRGSGFISGNELNILGTYNIEYSVSNTTGNELVDDQSTNGETAIEDFTVSGGASIVLNKDIFVNGDFTSTGSTFDGSSNKITFSGPGINTISGSNITFGDVTIESGAQVEGSNSTMFLTGTWTNDAGSSGFDGRSGTVDFSGSGAQTINTSGAPFNTVRFSTSASTKSITGDLNAEGSFIINSGVSVATNSNILVGNTWQNFGTFDAGSGTVTFNGATQSIDSQGDPFYNLTLEGTGTTKTLTSAIVVLNNLSIGNGVTFSNGGGSTAITVGGSWINDGTAYTSGPTGIVTFNGANSVMGSTTTQFSSVVVSGSSFSQMAPMKVARNWNVTVSSFSHGDETITFNGNSNQAINPGNEVYSNLTFSGPGTKTLNADIVLDGDLLLNAGPFNASGRTITLGGDFVKAGGVSLSTGINLVFNGGGHLLSTASQSFNSVHINPGSNVTVSSGSTISMQNLVVTGTFANPITIQSSSAGTEAVFNQSSGTVDGNHLILQDIHGTGGATFNANNSTDLGNNDGWFFSSNSSPTDITLSSSTVDEEQPVNTQVGTLSTSDPDGGDVHSYSLVAGTGDDNNSDFNITGNELRTSSIFDYETKSSYSIRIQTNDGNGGLFEKQFDVTIIDIDENSAPTDISLSSSDVDEGSSVGTVVGDLSTTDPDASDIHTYQFVTGTGDSDNSSFQIAGNQLQTAVVFDFETKSSYSIRIESDDGNGGKFEKEFVISINDIVENSAPTDIALSATSVDEGLSIGSIVGVFSTSDLDVGDNHTYQLISGTGDTDNSSFSLSGDQLLTAEVFDFETKTSYSIRISTNDGHAGSFEKTFTISINDVLENSAPTDITLSQTHIDENMVSGSEVGNLSTSDPDIGDTHTYVLTAGAGDSDNGSFSISGNQLLTATIFDFETKSSYSIRISSSDGSLSVEKEFTITINDIVENSDPTDISLSESTIDEGMAVGTVVGNLSTTDPDGSDSHTYDLVSGTGDTDNSSFTITGNQLLTAEVFDFSVKSSYSIRVASDDGNGGAVEKIFSIIITEVPVTGITDLDLTEITIYPNPVTSRLLIETPVDVELTYQLYNMNGVLLFDGKTGGQITELDVTGLKSGAHLINLRYRGLERSFIIVK